MARTRITPNPPSSSRNPPPKTRGVISSQNLSSSRNPPRDPNIPSNQAERPAPSQTNQPQPTLPQTGETAKPLYDYKKLYPRATLTLLGETSSINTELAVLRLKRGDKPHLSFSKEHDDKVTVHPCLPGEPVCTDDQGNNGGPFFFVYATVFK